MGTRSGDIDPAIVNFIADKEGLSQEEANEILNKKSGVLGISGVSSDFRDIEAAAEDGTAFVFLGHGTAHVAKVSYSQMATQMKELEFNNVFIGTVEGEPESTSAESIIEAVKEAGYTKVILRPLMVVAGDHANNDMAGDDEDSWKSMFEAAGFDVSCQIAGLGRIPTIQAQYIVHTVLAMAN